MTLQDSHKDKPSVHGQVFCCDICGFLKENGIGHTVGHIGGHDVIYTGESTAILPVGISAENPEEAHMSAASLKKAVDTLSRDTGQYPLVITEDRWRSQGDMMRLRVLAHLHVFTQIYARNCEVRKIDKATAAGFLQANHSYGDASCRYRYGLFLKRHTGHNASSGQHGRKIIPGTLVAVATFSNARKWVKGDKTIRSYEWTRYASLPDVRLSGGMGKLLKAFIGEVGPDDIMTYADLEWSEGKVYETLGFTLDGYKEPVCFCVDASWRRSARFDQATSPASVTATSLRAFSPERSVGERGNLYFQNLGSNKYRLKLTDYQ